jgi:hypothetical protein
LPFVTDLRDPIKWFHTNGIPARSDSRRAEIGKDAYGLRISAAHSGMRQSCVEAYLGDGLKLFGLSGVKTTLVLPDITWIVST